MLDVEKLRLENIEKSWNKQKMSDLGEWLRGKKTAN
jgi:hypothetical protein